MALNPTFLIGFAVNITRFGAVLVAPLRITRNKEYQD
jgi:hypothetical protein